MVWRSVRDLKVASSKPGRIYFGEKLLLAAMSGVEQREEKTFYFNPRWLATVAMTISLLPL